MAPTDKQPMIAVAAYGNGMFVRRYKVKNGGSFNFTCVPRDNVSLAVEINSQEVQTFSLGQLSNIMVNRQDLTVAWSDKTSKPPPPSVVSANTAYRRTAENQRLFDQAITHISKNEVDTSVKLLEKLVERDRDDFVVWTQLGIFYFNKDQLDDSTAAFERAIQLDGAYLPALLGGGRAYLADKRISRAIEVLKKAYETTPESADVNHYLGEAYLQDKKGSLAIPLLRKAIELEPVAKATLHLRIAALYNAAGGKALAAQEYAAFLKLVPSYPERERLERYIKENSTSR